MESRSNRMSISSASTLQQSDPSLLRSRNKRRDETLRKKLDSELSKKQPKKQPPKKKNTVSSLKPAPAITVLETARIVQAAQLMAAKRADAVLAINEEGQLSGILTDKDIAYRVVADGLDIRSTPVSSVMTRNPISVYDKGNRNEALNIMVERKFRHLPVITDLSDEFEDEVTSNVVGLLDITKCVFERLEDLERKVNEDQSIISAMEVLERRGTFGADQMGQMKSQHSCPDVSTLVGEDVEVGIKATVRDAARVMKEMHSTAVVVVNHDAEEKLAGIFTTKDIVLRVVAAGLDPNTTSVVRVMTPHPDSVPLDTSILDALKKLHVGHYLHLPVVNDATPVGLVDVLHLTIAMLNYLVTKDSSETQTQVSEGPMWNRFWNSTLGDDVSDRQSVVSESVYAQSVSYNPKESYAPSQSGYMKSPDIRGGMVGDDQSVITSQYNYAPQDDTFHYKLKLDSKVYRFTSTTSYVALCETIYKKTGVLVTGKQVGYIDEDGDFVRVAGDRELEDAVRHAKQVGVSRVVIEVRDEGGIKGMLQGQEKMVGAAVVGAAVLVVGAVVFARLSSRY